MSKTVRINVVLPDQSHTVARFLATRRGTTVSDIVRTALQEYVHGELLKEQAMNAKCAELGIAE